MDLGFSTEQTALRDSVREFLANEYPITLAKESSENPMGYSVPTWRKLSDLGWLGIGMPPEYGGGGFGLMETALMYEEFGRGLYQCPHFGGTFLCGSLIQRLGSEAQKRALLPGLASGSLIMSLAFLEENARWEEAEVRLQSRRAAGGWELTGTKLFVTHATAADELLCAARNEGGKGISLFHIRHPKDLAISLMPSAYGNLYYQVDFQGYRVQEEDVVGAPGAAWPALAQTIERAAALQCAEMVGLAQRILDMSAEYAKHRVQFGHPIGAYQGIQHVLAEMLGRLDASRLLTYQAVSFLDEGLPARRELAMAKAYVNEGAYQIALDGMQVLGGVGFTIEHPLPHYAMRVLYGKMNLGDTDVHIEQVAQALGL